MDGITFGGITFRSSVFHHLLLSVAFPLEAALPLVLQPSASSQRWAATPDSQKKKKTMWDVQAHSLQLTSGHFFPLCTVCTLLVPTMSCKVHPKPHYFKRAISSLPQEDASCPIPIPTAPRELSMAWGATAPHLHGEVSLQLSVRGGCRGRKRLPIPEQAVEEILHAHGAILVQAVEHPLEHLRAAGGRNYLVIAKSTTGKDQKSCRARCISTDWESRLTENCRAMHATEILPARAYKLLIVVIFKHPSCKAARKSLLAPCSRPQVTRGI